MNIEKEIVYLIKNKPFYAHFIQNMNRVFTESIETLGVNITEQINLYINPKFFNTLQPLERVACLEHETLHILNKHILRSKNRNPDIFNIAGDIAVNQYIENLPNGALQPEQFKLEREKETEYYYKKLIKKADKIKVMILDNHSLWEKGNKNKDYQHQVVKGAIQKTLEHTKNYGHLPANIQAEITKALIHETANWKSILHKFIHRATLVFTVPTRKKLNRRFGFYFDGSRVECKLDLMVAIDTSGSISDEDLSLFFAEINKIKALGMKITICEIDTVIHKVYKYTFQPKLVCGRGGTDFKPFFEYVKKMGQKPNALIYLTDLEASLNFSNVSRVPTLWAITQQGGEIKDIPFGIGIKLKDDIGSV